LKQEYSELSPLSSTLALPVAAYCCAWCFLLLLLLCETLLSLLQQCKSQTRVLLLSNLYADSSLSYDARRALLLARNRQSFDHVRSAPSALHKWPQLLRPL
jgi:hypothetical protein